MKKETVKCPRNKLNEYYRWFCETECRERDKCEALKESARKGKE
jgi:hypothetical protein